MASRSQYMTVEQRKAFALANAFARQGKVTEVEKLLEHGGVKITKTLVSCAVEFGSTKLLRMLLQHGWNINMPGEGNEPSFLGKAIKDQDEILVQWFLENGADPNRSSDQGATPLSRAAHHAPLNIIQLLFEYGASAEKGYPLNFACFRDDQDTKVLEFLLKKGASVDRLTYEDEADKGWAQLLGATPLMIACANRNFAAIKLLLQKGANPKKPRLSGMSALDEARETGQQDIVDILSKKSR